MALRSPLLLNLAPGVANQFHFRESYMCPLECMPLDLRSPSTSLAQLRRFVGRTPGQALAAGMGVGISNGYVSIT